MRARLAVRAAIGGGAAVAILGLAAVGAVAATRSGAALPGTRVGGVDVGGLDRQQVLARIADLAARSGSGALVVTADGRRVPVDRRRLVAPVDAGALADAALAAGRTGYPLAGLFGPLLPGAHTVRVPVRIDQAALATRVRQLAAGLHRPVHPGDLSIRGTTVTVDAPAPGVELDQQQARALLAAALRAGSPGPVALAVTHDQPQVPLREVQAAATRARAVLAGPVVLTDGSATLTVTTRQVAEALRTRRAGGRLALTVDRDRLHATVEELAAAIDRPAREARLQAPARPVLLDTKTDLTWSPRPVPVRVEPGQAGRSVDVDAAVDALARLVATGQHAGPLSLRPVAPHTSTRDLAPVTQVLGTFTTYYRPGQPRVTNIHRIAQLVDGTVIAPGATFSLNGIVGRRTRAKGFVADGAIVNGQLEDQVGGGVSQFATTTFNAAFFAGLPLTAYQPHSFYISRYPPGRESTVNYPTIDLAWRNDTGSPVVVRTATTMTSVSVTLYGANGGRRVSATTTRRLATPDGGFEITVVRTISSGRRQAYAWHYDPPPTGE